METPFEEYLRLWIAFAERDLSYARRMARSGMYDACAFFCEQAVEKMLKARYLSRERRDAPRTHQIVKLAQIVGLAGDLAEDLHDLERDYMQSRYPDMGWARGELVYDASVAEERLAVAERVLAWLREQMEEDDGDTDGSE